MKRFQPLSDLRLCIFDADGFSLSSIRRAAVAAQIHDVTVHPTVDEAQTALGGRTADAVVIHWLPPFEHGLRLCQSIRSPGKAANPFLPILMISAHAGRQHLMTARNAGIDEFLVTPFGPGDFVARLRAAVFERRPFIDVPTYFGPDRRTGDLACHLGTDRRRSAASLLPVAGLSPRRFAAGRFGLNAR